MQPVQYFWNSQIELALPQLAVVNDPLILTDSILPATVSKIIINAVNPQSTFSTFIINGFDFLNNVQTETLTLPINTLNITSVNFYRSISSIIPQTSAEEDIYVYANVQGYTQPYICDVFNKNALYSYEVNITTSNFNFTITPQYTLSNFSGYNNLNVPKLNTTVSNIVWLPLPAATNPPIPGTPAQAYGYSFPEFPITALRLNVTTTNQFGSLTFEAKILQQGVWM